jgi:hypothetical protein
MEATWRGDMRVDGAAATAATRSVRAYMVSVVVVRWIWCGLGEDNVDVDEDAGC